MNSGIHNKPTMSNLRHIVSLTNLPMTHISIVSTERTIGACIIGDHRP